MASIEVSGLTIEYELLGEVGAPAVALNPAARFAKELPRFRELAEALVAGGRRVLLWDRPNCGGSDLCFEGRTESEMQGAVLVQLVRALRLGPTAMAGSRASFFAAAQEPDAVSHLLLWLISGGMISSLVKGADYCGWPASAARMGGMGAVAQIPHWADQVQRDPRKRDRFLGQDTDHFVTTMERWAQAFVLSDASPVPGMRPEDFRRLTMPTLIFRGSEKDIFHPRAVSERVRGLIPHSEIVEPPWSEEAPLRCLATTEAPEGVPILTATGTSPLLDWVALAPAILDFTGRKP